MILNDYKGLSMCLINWLKSFGESFKSWGNQIRYTVKLGDKERFDKEQIGVKEPFPVTNCQFTS